MEIVRGTSARIKKLATWIEEEKKNGLVYIRPSPTGCIHEVNSELLAQEIITIIEAPIVEDKEMI